MIQGYLTQTDIVNLKINLDSASIESDQLQDLISKDLASDAKQAMFEGVNYYNAEHDILDRIKYYFVDQTRLVDQFSANNKLPHPFHKMLVDQKASYIAGQPIKIGTKESAKETESDMDEELQEHLSGYLGDEFNDLVNDWIIGSSNKGVEWVHPYIDEDGILRIVIMPAEQIIPIYDSQYQNKLLAVIRYYIVEYIGEDGATQERYKAEFWTSTDVTYYYEEDSGQFILDPEVEINPAPHWQIVKSNGNTPESKSWGKVPFIPLENNSGTKTDLQPIKHLIDAYDSVKSGWVNDIDDFQELIMVLRGYSPMSLINKDGMSELAQFMQNLKANKVISVDNDGGVDSLRSEIPVEAKNKFLELTRNEIFYFGEGVDTSADNFGTAPSGVALKFLYSSLDIKSNRIIRKLTVSLKELMYFVLEWINFKEGKKYNYEVLTFTFNKSIIINKKEEIEAIKASEGDVSRRTRLEHHPLVSDVEEELERLEEEESSALEESIRQLNAAQTRQEASTTETETEENV